MRSYCIIGDSIGRGIVWDEEKAKYCSIAAELAAGVHSRIKNVAVMGATVEKGLQLVRRQEHYLPGYDAVLLEFGGNDCDYDWKAVSTDPKGSHRPKTPLSEFLSGYTEIVDRIRTAGAEPIVLSMPPLEPTRYLDWISKGCSKANILQWLGSADTIYRWQEMYNLQVMALSRRLCVPFIDFRSIFLSNHHYSDWLCLDGIHPNWEGYTVIWDTVKEALAG
jgi:lysophospholipase L1-like esterase